MDIPQESCVLPQALTVLRGQVAAGLLSLKKGRSWVWYIQILEYYSVLKNSL